MTDREIIDQLLSLGFSKDKIPEIIRDVSGIIAGKIMASYTASLSERQKLTLNRMTPEEVKKYILSHKDEFPKISPEALQKVYDEVWIDYLSNLRKK